MSYLTKVNTVKCLSALASESAAGALVTQSVRDYNTKILPVPRNIDPNETVKFSPQRHRDLAHKQTEIVSDVSPTKQFVDITLDTSNEPADPRMSSYDCRGAVSLNSVMQSNVPSPFSGANNYTHLNMPGGQWEQGSKYMAHDLQSSHYMNLRQSIRSDFQGGHDKGIISFIGHIQRRSFCTKNNCLIIQPVANQIAFKLINNHPNWALLYLTNKFSTSNLNNNTAKNANSDIKDEEKKVDDKTLSGAAKLKQLVKEYGGTVMIFHVGISLMSLGFFYALVSSGIDVVAILQYFGLENSAITSKIAAGGSTFIIAYAIHKIFAPVRISITLGSAPFIVRYLRQKGILKPPKTW